MSAVPVLLRWMAAVLPWDILGWLAGFALIMLLSAKELVRAYAGTRYGNARVSRWLRGFDLASALPLLVFTLAALVRVLAVITH